MRNSFAPEKNLPLVTCLLIVINFIVYFVLEWFGSTEDGFYMLRHGALYAPNVLVQREYYRLLTAAFLHFGAAHIMNNMLMLFIMGQRLEYTLGKVRFLIVYLLSAVGANLFTLVYYNIIHRDAISAGASGALLGIIGALFAVLLRNHGRVQDMNRRQMMILIALTLYSGFVSESTNNAAHISGLVFGFLLGLVLYRPHCRSGREY